MVGDWSRVWPVEPPTGHRATAWYPLELAGNGEQVLDRRIIRATGPEI